MIHITPVVMRVTTTARSAGGISNVMDTEIAWMEVMKGTALVSLLETVNEHIKYVSG